MKLVQQIKTSNGVIESDSYPQILFDSNILLAASLVRQLVAVTGPAVGDYKIFVQNFLYKNKNGFDICPQILPTKLLASATLTVVQLELQNRQDHNLLSKFHLPNALSGLFGQPMSTLDNDLEAPPYWLFKSITKKAATDGSKQF